ncbi:hypothetical protein BKA65DRAFT_495218 [Rhexocercosporidium sp. MPI-PUGE-AT-0058]|nr:hypothetical protein BKA65DRAFT_495218 [Rhexocercosporidium sp. MPI-PUGE-AT-0058]
MKRTGNAVESAWRPFLRRKLLQNPLRLRLSLSSSMLPERYTKPKSRSRRAIRKASRIRSQHPQDFCSYLINSQVINTPSHSSPPIEYVDFTTATFLSEGTPTVFQQITSQLASRQIFSLLIATCLGLSQLMFYQLFSYFSTAIPTNKSPTDSWSTHTGRQ